ncbi:MAG: hypothetical protein ABIO36_05760 [Pyrinomonadaceae bacterium]
MKAISHFVVTLILIAVLLSSALPCGPGYITPLFDTTAAPESPYVDYAAGRLGIIKPTFRRSVLYAAYRYVAGSGMNAAEQQAMIDVWKAEIDNKDFRDDSVDAAVKAWVDKRKDVVGNEEKIPDIYAERTYGGYDFFPNCTKNAFETAAETLVDRASNHGPSDSSVVNWVKGQDQVFENCASGKQTPDPAPTGAPDWLQKDRAYQTAAASFYSLDYVDAKRRFAEIAQDTDSPWQETADYLVARTLIRQASLSKTPEKAAPFYDEAEAHLQKFISRSGKFAASAEQLVGLIKYRRHPAERVSELAKTLSFYGGNDNFRQDVIDYNWLIDKFSSEILTVEEKRRQDEEAKNRKDEVNNAPDAGNRIRTANAANTTNATANAMANAANIAYSSSNANTSTSGAKTEDDDASMYLTSDDGKQSWSLYFNSAATDAELFAAAEKLTGDPLSEAMKKRVQEGRRDSYAGRFSAGQQSAYEGGYWGEERLTPSLIPGFLRQDDLTDWLFCYQMPGAEAYIYSLNKFKAGGSELWLMTALSKADKSSTGLARLLEAANNTSRTSPAYTTIAYYRARILLFQNKTADARKLLDEMINLGDELPISARNSFIDLRLHLAATLEDFLKDSLKKPWGFDFDGDAGSVDDIIARQKQDYNPEYNTDGREAYEQEIDENYKDEKLWQDRLMFDTDTIELFNQHFSNTSMLEVMRSPALPDYMRERFAVAIWTRSYLLNDTQTLLKVTPELAKYRPEFEAFLTRVTNAKTPAARENALLFFVIKNPLLSPYIEDGMGKTDNEAGDFDSNDWWCERYDSEYSEEIHSEVPKGPPPRPAFLTAAQSQAAQTERKRLKVIGDAPKFLAAKVMDWAKHYPADRRVPEALYIMIQANGWTKYGCGNNEELRDEMAAYLKKHYPNSEWTSKLTAEESEK